MTGDEFHLQHYLGAHREEKAGESGYTFRVWAPNAQAVHLVGDFTNWLENQIPMERNEFGVWEVFTSLAQEGQIYKYNITRATGHQLMKIDPMAVRYEARPGTGAILTDIPEKKWKEWALASPLENAGALKSVLSIFMRSMLVLGREILMATPILLLN